MSPFLVILSLTLFFAVDVGESNETCYTRGECLNSPYGFLKETEDAKACHEECLAVEECSAFTWYNSSRVCIGFLECVEFSNETCSDCVSGLQNCLEPVCFEQGRCLGNFLDYQHSETENECLHLCQSHSFCSWFTFDEELHGCTLLDGCSTMEKSCISCQSGQRYCQDKPELTKLLVIRGNNNRKIEAIDLSSIDAICEEPGQLESEAYKHSPAFMYRGRVHVCGGYASSRNCYFYDYPNSKWIETTPMRESRFAFQVVKIGYEEYWILGGEDENNKPRESTEILINGTFYPGPVMPHHLAYFCSVQINSSFVFVGGGHTLDVSLNKTYYTNSAFLIDLETKQWIQLASFDGERHAHACGLFKDELGNGFIVVAGGRISPDFRKDSRILDLQTLTWSDGPDLPTPLGYISNAVVQNQDHFLISGGGYVGESGAIYSSIIMKFDRNLKWEIAVQTISPRDAHAVILVPDEMVNCS